MDVPVPMTVVRPLRSLVERLGSGVMVGLQVRGDVSLLAFPGPSVKCRWCMGLMTSAQVGGLRSALRILRRQRLGERVEQQSGDLILREGRSQI